MAYNLREAGAATGKSTSTILRAVKSGLISANQTRRNAGWSIDPSELHRVFPPVENLGTDVKSWKDDSPELRQRLQDMQATVEDLRRRLDQEADDRRKLQTENHALQAKLTAVLSDQRSTMPPAGTHDHIPVVKYEAPRSRWLGRWRRKIPS